MSQMSQMSQRNTRFRVDRQSHGWNLFSIMFFYIGFPLALFWRKKWPARAKGMLLWSAISFIVSVIATVWLIVIYTRI